MGCNMTEDIEKRIDRCVEKYQNLVKEINDLEFEHNIYEGRMENYKDLLIKEDLTPSEFKLLTIYKSLKVDNDIVLRMLENKKEILESKKPYFEIGASDVLNELQKMTGGEIIARKLDNECRVEHNDLGFLNTDFVYNNKYELGVNVGEREIMLPKVEERYYDDVTAYEALPCIHYNRLEDGLIGSTDETLAKPEFQEMFWNLFKNKLMSLVDSKEQDSLKGQLEEMKRFEVALDEITK